MGSSESTPSNFQPKMMYYGPHVHRAQPLMSCEYARNTNLGTDDIFEGHLRIAGCKSKELRNHPPAMRSQSETKNLVDMNPQGAWNMDNSCALAYRPKNNALCHGKQTIPNVTHMARHCREGGEFGIGPNKVDSVDKHCNYRVDKFRP
jgi:hypothetical protein